MRIRASVLGVDIGSVSISVAEIGTEGEVLQTAYRFHQGKIEENLRSILDGLDLSRINWIASTSSTSPVLKISREYDSRVSIMTACRHFYDVVGSILIVGGERFGLMRFDEQGQYLNFKANTSCAAGTGSFLDQQAKRLGLHGVEELAKIALSNQGTIPKIASRCAVFAKTDLAHAQQEGYSLAEICDGLCYGLAENIYGVLFKGERPRDPVIFAGGVSKNRAVANHLESLCGMALVQDEKASAFGAIGAALSLVEERHAVASIPCRCADDVLTDDQARTKTYFYKPLSLEQSAYPAFSRVETYEFSPQEVPSAHPVEVDIYESQEPGERIEAHLGIDIGSTSTKAALVDGSKTVLAGFYTRTAGRPVNAVLQLFAAMDNWLTTKGLTLNVIGAGTTGSGRKLAGKIIGADLIVDEITAHARAAYELNPEVDTIIEIGGQDSKFTTLRNGRVTFSVMNTVCAAGTGSFIEEQAQRLGCKLAEFSTRTENQRAPLASDRCTVFMERDLNHYLADGYAVEEVLAAVLHSIRDNYLTKVAVPSSIGKAIAFQGATARNRALVAAFEQKLGQPIQVSQFCHLTGAVGTALMVGEQGVSQTGFRGVGLHKSNIPVRSEVCELCTNHCKITVADVDHTPVAYGFLCGRDYDTRQYVSNDRSGFDLLKEREKIFSFKPRKKYDEKFTIGIPAALHMYEDLPLWRRFFDELSIPTVTSLSYKGGIKEGKHLAGAEFCAPMAALHGHVGHLLDKADYVFLPFYLEHPSKGKGERRQYCYYTQFASPLVASMEEPGSKSRLLMPLINYVYTSFYAKVQLYRMLKSISRHRISFLDVSSSYDKAMAWKKASLSKLRKTYRQESATGDDVQVVFLGRPYSILCQDMNKGIPGIFASMGVKVFFQDMLPWSAEDLQPIRGLLNELPWYYASQIMAAAQVLANTKNAYPVFITSFKCTPDAFALDYFKKIMEYHDKPYLILQLDEHDSNVGYETRIEAALRSFRNHYGSSRSQRYEKHPFTILPPRKKRILDKTLIIPAWDRLALTLVTANMQREGIDARLLEETKTGMQKSLVHNSGQCIPLNIIAQEFIEYVEKHDLDPENTVLWNISSTMACNLAMFPYHTRTILNAYGKGMEKAGIYSGAMSFADISLKLPVNAYFAYLFGGLLRKMGCKVRPYEKNQGETDGVIQTSLEILKDAFYGKRSKEDAVAEVVSRFEKIDACFEARPQVAIFGDLYARDNEVMNQNLVHYIERNGGEVITTPYSAYAKMIAPQYLRKWFIEGLYMEALSTKALMAMAKRMEGTYYKYFERVLKEPAGEYDDPAEGILSEYNLRVENTGESMDSILKIHYLTKHYPDISLFVQTNPAFCCPSIVTEAMARDIERNTQVPVVSITYDGTSSNKNDVIIPYLKFPRKRALTRDSSLRKGGENSAR